ncbi:PREDICTED: suppressor of IKBKE 1 isoform X2 [Crocodylus porosus]|uniref:suppressor of IKBKE 1 isoform X2 n=1 Tax=Crocodylus porosus TaxID=8502 RepID=UPI00093D2359|nr:PREDICTED: suppressor of IKBKE 1 isoform X2 [Crocodylus porosus]
MSCTIEKILTDARTLLDRLRDHDSAAESLIDQSAALHRRVAAMRQAGAAGAKQVGAGGGRRAGATGPPPACNHIPPSCQAHDEAANVKDASKLKPHLLLSQENTQIRDLQRENRELWISLEEHQDALELIMSKYRKQMLQLTRGRKDEDAEPVLKVHQAQSVEIESQIDRIYEMGEVMRKAVQVDDDQFFTIQEKLAQLELENKELRELLSISTESPTVRVAELPDSGPQELQNNCLRS